MAAKTFLLENGLDVLREVVRASRVRFLRNQGACLEKQQRRYKEEDDKTTREGFGVSFYHNVTVDTNLGSLPSVHHCSL